MTEKGTQQQKAPAEASDDAEVGELINKIPPVTQKSEEWGERLSDARTIASGGKKSGAAERSPGRKA